MRSRPQPVTVAASPPPSTPGFLETLEIDLDDAATDCQDLGR